MAGVAPIRADPLLANEIRQNWLCNLIHFDNDAVWGRASYYVQTLYAQNRPDYNVKTRMFSNEQNLLTRGRIGLGTWNTRAEFRNIRVVSHDGSHTYYESDFLNKLYHRRTEAGHQHQPTDAGHIHCQCKEDSQKVITLYSRART